MHNKSVASAFYAFAFCNRMQCAVLVAVGSPAHACLAGLGTTLIRSVFIASVVILAFTPDGLHLLLVPAAATAVFLVAVGDFVVAASPPSFAEPHSNQLPC